MNQQNYLRLSGIIFGLVAVFHLIRIVFNWSVVIGPYDIPVWISYIGLVVAAILSYFGCKYGKLLI